MERTPTFQVQHFGNYYLLERIAVGGMAEIFKAKQVGVRGFEKIVVIKKILQHLSEDPEFVEMFEDEAKLAAQLNQANIVQIYELGEVDETLYITMEYIDGRNLRDVTRAASGRGIHLSIEQAVALITESLKGLDYAHRKTDSLGNPLHIVHRDISPQNIILSYEGEVKILDFGIAKAASKISKTEAGVLKGKFSYMSPEQASGKPIDQTSDIYAIGVILHELLTSERLFRSKSDMETLEKVKAGFVSPPSEKNSQIPPELDRIVLKALAKEREQRYQSASEMLQDLQKFAFDQQFTTSNQDLSAFMKTLFADTIKEEKQRLLETLKKVPSSPHQELQNARTHITFKRDSIESAPAAQQGKRDLDPEITATKSQPFLSTAVAKPARLAVLVLFILAIGGVLLWQRLSDNQRLVEDRAQEATKPSEPAKKMEKQPLIPIPVPPPPDEKKVDDILKRDGENSVVDPAPVPAEKALEEEKPKLDLPKPREVPRKPKAAPVKAKEPARPVEEEPQATGRINVTAPPEGFANLFINDKGLGTVPGPKARNIEVPAGRVSIRCETTSRVYSGSVRVRANERITIKCQDLKG